MQAHTAQPHAGGRPPSPVSALASRRDGMTRQTVDFHREMLEAISDVANAVPTGPVSRAIMIRVLLGEALAARGVEWTPSPVAPAKKKKKARK